MSDRPNYTSISNTSVTDSVYKEELAKEEPDCMKKLQSVEVDPTSNSLSKEEYVEAKTELVKNNYTKLKFPKILKSRADPPLNGQIYHLHSFIPSPEAKPDKDGCFGVIKFRGSFPNMQDANERSELLIRTIDSYNDIFIGFVGKNFPLTLRSDFCLETQEIDVRNKVDEIEKENIKKQREKEQKDIEDIQERERKLLSQNKETKIE